MNGKRRRVLRVGVPSCLRLFSVLPPSMSSTHTAPTLPPVSLQVVRKGTGLPLFGEAGLVMARETAKELLQVGVGWGGVDTYTVKVDGMRCQLQLQYRSQGGHFRRARWP